MQELWLYLRSCDTFRSAPWVLIIECHNFCKNILIGFCFFYNKTIITKTFAPWTRFIVYLKWRNGMCHRWHSMTLVTCHRWYRMTHVTADTAWHFSPVTDYTAWHLSRVTDDTAWQLLRVTDDTALSQVTLSVVTLCYMLITMFVVAQWLLSDTLTELST